MGPKNLFLFLSPIKQSTTNLFSLLKISQLFLFLSLFTSSKHNVSIILWWKDKQALTSQKIISFAIGIDLESLERTSNMSPTTSFSYQINKQIKIDQQQKQNETS